MTICFLCWCFVYKLSLCVQTLTLCTNFHSVYKLSLCVQTLTLCTNSHFVYKLSLCVQTLTLCTNSHFVYKLSLCIQTLTLCTNSHYCLFDFDCWHISLLHRTFIQDYWGHNLVLIGIPRNYIWTSFRKNFHIFWIFYLEFSTRKHPESVQSCYT